MGLTSTRTLLTLSSTSCWLRRLLLDANVWILYFTDSQASRGATSERENQPQPGQPEEPPAAPTGRGDPVRPPAHRPVLQAPAVGAKKLFTSVLSVAGSGRAQGGEGGDPGAHCCLSAEKQSPEQAWSCWRHPERLLPRRLLRLPGESCWLPGAPAKGPAPPSGAAAARLCCLSQARLCSCRLEEQQPRPSLLRLTAAPELLHIHPSLVVA